MQASSVQIPEFDRLEVRELVVSVEGKQVLKGVNLAVSKGEVHAIMGPNGSGKSTLAYTLMGHPKYKVDGGQILLNGEDITSLSADKRARRGLFLAFQYPVPISGLSLFNFMRAAYNATRPPGAPKPTIVEFRRHFFDSLAKIGLPQDFANRYVNDGWSGGEKKMGDIFQMAVLRPSLVVLDETDSGLDIDALKRVSAAINSYRGPEVGMILITHYNRILQYVRPDFVHILVDGRIIRSGGPELADEVERIGYEGVLKQA
ncbi:MAG: Fe-S cluster assembly ATPase SufC [Nitrososphaerota archaeon]